MTSAPEATAAATWQAWTCPTACTQGAYLLPANPDRPAPLCPGCGQPQVAHPADDPWPAIHAAIQEGRVAPGGSTWNDPAWRIR